MAADGDGSTTESEEFFDEEGDDDHCELAKGDDPLGGVSEQSSSRCIAAAAVSAGGDGDASHVLATTGAGVKQEQLVSVKRLDVPGAAPTAVTPMPIHAGSLLAPSANATASSGALSSASSHRADVSTAVKHESHTASLRHPAPPPPVSHAYGNSNYTNGSPGPTPAQPVYGYHPPPPVNYAPPRTTQTQYQSLEASQAPASNISTSAKPTTTTTNSHAAASVPSTYSAPSLADATVLSGGRAPSQCRHCFAKLNVPLLKIGRNCCCCGLIYPFSQFPMQNNQDKSPQRRCHACYAAWIKKNTVIKTKSTHSAVLRSQKSTVHTSLPSPPLHTANANSSGPRFAPISPPSMIPPSLAAQPQPSAAPGPTRAVAAQSSTSAAPVFVPAAATPAVAPGRKCPFCLKVTYNVQPSRNASANLKCACCQKVLLKNECFSKSQRKEGKRRCKACLGQVKLGSPSEPPPGKEPRQITQEIHTPVLRSEVVALSAERQVAKYHLARRSLQRKREADDLRGLTRMEYEKQLAKEDAELKALEAQLRAKFPKLFDKQVGIQVVAPSIPRGERDRPDTTIKKKEVGEPSEKSELRAKKKREQETAARLNSAANAVIQSATRRSTPEVFDLTGEPGPGVIALAKLSVQPPKPKAIATPARVKAANPVAPAVTTKPAAKPTTTTTTAAAMKRKEPTAASIQAVAKEKPTKKPKTSKTSTTTTANDDHDEDPWLAAHDEIAHGLSQLLGGNLDDILLGAAVKMEKKSQVKSESAPTISSSSSSSSVLPVKKEKKVKTEAQRPDPSTYAPTTKLQAETPPRTTIATRARKRVLQPPPEIIDMTDSPRPASPKEMKKMRFFI